MTLPEYQSRRTKQLGQIPWKAHKLPHILFEDSSCSHRESGDLQKNQTSPLLRIWHQLRGPSNVGETTSYQHPKIKSRLLGMRQLVYLMLPEGI